MRTSFALKIRNSSSDAIPYILVSCNYIVSRVPYDSSVVTKESWPLVHSFLLSVIVI
jgi:hypothetical protein